MAILLPFLFRSSDDSSDSESELSSRSRSRDDKKKSSRSISKLKDAEAKSPENLGMSILGVVSLLFYEVFLI